MQLSSLFNRGSVNRWRAIPPWKMVCWTSLTRNPLLPLQMSVPVVLTVHSIHLCLGILQIPELPRKLIKKNKNGDALAPPKAN